MPVAFNQTQIGDDAARTFVQFLRRNAGCCATGLSKAGFRRLVLESQAVLDCAAQPSRRRCKECTKRQTARASRGCERTRDHVNQSQNKGLPNQASSPARAVRCGVHEKDHGTVARVANASIRLAHADSRGGSQNGPTPGDRAHLRPSPLRADGLARQEMRCHRSQRGLQRVPSPHSHRHAGRAGV